VAYLLENGIDPRNILLLTFTNKAAREMLGSRGEFVAGRCQRNFGAGRSTPWQPNSAPARDAPGYSSGFTIMDREDQKDVINAVAARLTNYFHEEGYECLSAWTGTPKCDAHRKCRAIESVTNFLACVIAPSRDRPLARAAVIAAEYVQPVP
jgi:superfamily I DNA/RNA helicase